MERLKVGKYIIFHNIKPSKSYLIAGSFKTPNSSVVYITLVDVDSQDVLFGFFLTGICSKYFVRYSIDSAFDATLDYCIDTIDVGLSEEIINTKRDSWISATVREIKSLSKIVAKDFYDDKYEGVRFSKFPVYRRKMLNELDCYLHPDKYIIEFI